MVPVASPDRRLFSILLLAAAVASAALFAQSSPLPNRSGSLKFAAIGDNGTGDRPQYEVAQQMTKVHATFPFDLVIMLGDNMYGGQTAGRFRQEVRAAVRAAARGRREIPGVASATTIGRSRSPTSRST